MIVSDTINDAMMVVSTATGSDRVKSPAPSGKAISGRKAKISVAVQPMTATLISDTPAIAASRLGKPFRRCRAMFSVTTIESSTSNPSAITKPEIDSWFIV